MTAANLGPSMSVVLATPGAFVTIAATVHHLRRQSIAHRLELVIVAPSAETLSANEAVFQGFWGHQVVGVGPLTSVGRANAAGVRAARTDLVVFAEDHCFPEPGWAEALVERHARGDAAAVGPVFRNANPQTLVSWCDFAIGYGPWIDPTPAGEQPFLAGHNSSYRKSVLRSLDARLEELLASETVLHMELRKSGHRLVVEPRAKTAHTNFGRFRSWLPVQYHCGRVFAAQRAREWGWARRAFYAAASPMIPCVRFIRAAGHLRRAAPPRPSMLRVGPLLGLGLAVDGFGQFVGYLVGAGKSSRRLVKFEFRRIDHVPESDRHLWGGVGNPAESLPHHA
jgi:hypothetical protein